MSKVNQSTPDSSGSNNGNSGSGTNENPDTSLNQEKQSGEAQQNGDTWGQESSHTSTWWIWPLGLAACAGGWFLIWKRKKDDEDTDSSDSVF